MGSADVSRPRVSCPKPLRGGSTRALFEALSERLSKALSFLRDKKELTDERIEQGLARLRTGVLRACEEFTGSRAAERRHSILRGRILDFFTASQRV